MNLNLSQISHNMEPIKEWSDSNEHAVNRLVQLQQYYFKDVVGASFEQFRSLSQCSDPEQALKMNFYFCKGLEAHANYLSNQAMETLSEVHSISLKTWDEASDRWASSMDQILEDNLRPYNR
ncbi:MAG: phasin family protein [Motiliproteus sp.]|nr:phasin family protein [Motiliproteus sp.]MCW9053722.1 phasin family protein [Motiliproteus sp.]